MDKFTLHLQRFAVVWFTISAGSAMRRGEWFNTIVAALTATFSWPEK